MVDINVFITLGAGFLSFISPCCLPLYPAFLSYITGMTLEEKRKQGVKIDGSFLHTILFLLGFSTIFIVLGFGTSAIGFVFKEYQEWMRRVGAIIMIAFGLMITGVIRLPFLNKELRFVFKKRPIGYTGSYLIGLSFAAGWTPCTGPIIGTVIYLASTNPQASFLYMFAYILGFSIPFFLLAYVVDKQNSLKKYHLAWMKIGGCIMILVGVLLYNDWLKKMIEFISPLFGSFNGF